MIGLYIFIGICSLFLILFIAYKIAKMKQFRKAGKYLRVCKDCLSYQSANNNKIKWAYLLKTSKSKGCDCRLFIH